MEIARSMLGVAVLLLLAFAVSNNRRAIRPRVVFSALVAQFAIGALVLFVLSKISPRFHIGFLDVVGQVFETFDQNLGWIVGFWFVLLYGAILYGFLFAPHGVLCILHLRPCGSW